ncbi:uncharacterized protein LOC126907097 [Daktulosphaira vitifoliae]|uniref:uncharacterized protein LOC126907097 n=1 Tax=Daktulosphaira vitifoliae TaxID=58002 RepID=UPI0021AAB82F|nr:uncharacterized protein LOC126907097 [Daktulosphaira vitifoliae]XP_050544104.1 uncharacterized protein LOC126907097 [Daktulosphaira vitifoliae]
MPLNGNMVAKYLVMVSQVIAWCMVSVMLLRKGFSQVQESTHIQNHNSSEVGNSTIPKNPEVQSFDNSGTTAIVAGVVMIAIALIMLIISPTIMFMKMMEKRKENIHNNILESPPKYEDVVECAPRYSSLFVFNSTGDIILLSSGKVVQKTSTLNHDISTIDVHKSSDDI